MATCSDLSVSAVQQCSASSDAFVLEATASLGQKLPGHLRMCVFQGSLLRIGQCRRLSQPCIVLAFTVASPQMAFQVRTAPSPWGNGPDPALAGTRDTCHKADQMQW